MRGSKPSILGHVYARDMRLLWLPRRYGSSVMRRFRYSAVGSWVRAAACNRSHAGNRFTPVPWPTCCCEEGERCCGRVPCASSLPLSHEPNASFSEGTGEPVTSFSLRHRSALPSVPPSGLPLTDQGYRLSSCAGGSTPAPVLSTRAPAGYALRTVPICDSSGRLWPGKRFVPPIHRFMAEEQRGGQSGQNNRGNRNDKKKPRATTPRAGAVSATGTAGAASKTRRATIPASRLPACWR